MSRGMSKAARLQRVEALLSSSPKGCSVRQIADALGVHRTTIWRDLNELSCEVPVQQEDNRYRIDRNDYISSVRLSRSESLLLYLALRRLVRWPSHILSQLALALEKLAGTLREPSDTSLVQSLHSIRQHQPGNAESARVWETLIQAWRERLAVRLSYMEFGGTVISQHEVQPYLFELGLLSEGTYLVGH
jgi:predicted DNA-binding transcriptional regulator YafY